MRLVSSGQSIATVAAIFGLANQALHNWLKADRDGRLCGLGTKHLSPEQMGVGAVM